MFTSTQQQTNSFSQKPSTSRYNQNNVHINDDYYFKQPNDVRTVNKLEDELNKLRKECESKNGENVILRSQINAMQLSLKIENEKKQKEINEKLQKAVKDLEASKSELQFKVSFRYVKH